MVDQQAYGRRPQVVQDLSAIPISCCNLAESEVAKFRARPWLTSRRCSSFTLFVVVPLREFPPL